MESTPPPIPGQSPADSAPQTSGLAIASLVLGIVGFCSAGLTAIPAVICGHMALSQIGKSAGRQTGGGMAISGLVTGYLSLVIGVIALLAGLALPVFGEVKERGNQTKALSIAKMVGTGCKLYAVDHDGKFPVKLEDLVPDYLPDAESILCPYPDPKNPVPFEYFGGSENDDPRKMLLASPAVEGKGRVFVYVDGSGEAKSRQKLKRGE
jgi:competence protein ComGC